MASRYILGVVTPAGASGISPLYSSHSCCPHFLAAAVAVGADHVSAKVGVLVMMIQSDDWGSVTLGGSSARLPRCKLVVLLLLESPVSGA